MPFEVITTQPTPNPNALKFVLGAVIAPSPQSFFNAPAAAGHAVASRLFAIKGVTNVLLLGDFVTISKTPEAKWAAITPAVKRVLAAAEAI
ncbi:MAG TPA: NifU N-terminal domain-containing protein [Tepidisphaeraceae bacterium]|nr:NifU N-terminal domain-containing protein [Tepidisphaeraceae bacterium]